MRIVAGNYYMTRSGKLVGPMVWRGYDNGIEHMCVKYPLVAVSPESGCLSGWLVDGTWQAGHPNHDLDLVSEYRQPVPKCESKSTKRKVWVNIYSGKNPRWFSNDSGIVTAMYPGLNLFSNEKDAKALALNGANSNYITTVCIEI